MKILKSLLAVGLLAIGISQAKAQNQTNFSGCAFQCATNNTAITITNPPSIVVNPDKGASMWVSLTGSGVVTNGSQFSLKGYDKNSLASTLAVTNVTSIANGSTAVVEVWQFPKGAFAGLNAVGPYQIIPPALTNITTVTAWGFEQDQ